MGVIYEYLLIYTCRQEHIQIASNNLISSFQEKPKGDGTWINGGYFVCSSKVLSYIDGDTTTFEQEPLKNLSNENQLAAFKHEGFWKCMDTLKDKIDLCNMWDKDQAPWVKSD